jgi:prepilin-type N-terminal cleavage/methylation domain-containing protein
MTLKNFLKPRAFSLIEISVVIIIIGIFIAGVVVADGMVSKFRIAAAKNLTQSSPISTFKDAALWLESSLDSSFNSSEAQNGASLSTWYDQKNSPNKVIVNTAGVSPTYSNTINRVHAVEFDGTSNKHFTFDGSFLNGTDYTIMILEKRKSSKSNNYFLGTPGSGLNNSLSLGYSANNQIIHAQGSNSYPYS